MDVTGLSSRAIFNTCEDIFRGRNDANLQIRGNIYAVARVAYYYSRHNHAVEWRYGDYTNVWISHRLSEVNVTIQRANQVEQTKTMVLRHNILCIRLHATGESCINWMWQIVTWGCANGFTLEHGGNESGNALSMRVVLRKPHLDLMEED